MNRRKFVGTAVASGVITIVPRHVLGGTKYVAPNDKITLAHIGMGTQGFRELLDAARPKQRHGRRVLRIRHKKWPHALPRARSTE